MTQGDLAKIAGVERTYLARIEAGASVFFLDRALRMLRRMGATVTVTMADTGASTLDEVLDRAGGRIDGSVSFATTVEALRQDRAGH